MLLILHNRFILTYTIHTRQISAKFGHRSRTEIKHVDNFRTFLMWLFFNPNNNKSKLSVPKVPFKGIIVCWDLAVEYFSCVKVIFI